MSMNAGKYCLCLMLMLPLAALTVYVALFESIEKIGLWKTLDVVSAPLADPLGEGRLGFAVILGMSAATFAGFSRRGRTFGFVFLSVAGAASFLFLLLTAADLLDMVVLLILSPSIAGLALSSRCAVRSFRGVSA